MQKEIDKTTPLRLARAVELAFPAGGMTVAGLRREIAKGRLVPEKIAGKHFVTLAEIEEMRRKCREEAKAPESNSAPPVTTTMETSPTTQPGLSATEAPNAAQDALNLKLIELSGRLRSTSPANTRPRAKSAT